MGLAFLLRVGGYFSCFELTTGLVAGWIGRAAHFAGSSLRPVSDIALADA
jgi:hypothetical protein